MTRFIVQRQGDQKIVKKLPNVSKNSPKSCQVKKGQNICNKAQFESPKHLQQTTFETVFLGENLINLLKQKVAQKVAIILGYLILSKIIMSHQK
jgi:predicted ABC-type ATPase